jgi:glycerophosphoryl diester phosphodiesterase
VLTSARDVAAWHAAGRAVHPWTVDDPREVAALAALGVDGLITNLPVEARAAIARLDAHGAGRGPDERAREAG